MSEEKTNFIEPESLVKNFPFAFRGNQEALIKDLEKHINRPEIKYIVIQAPTGSGKSPIAISLAKSAENAYILTSNKILQDQYVADFDKELADLRGRSNYNCNTHPGYNCGNSPCRVSKEGRAACSKASSCQYHSASLHASLSPVTSMNFAAGVSYFNFTDKFPKRELLIIDEAHTIQDSMTNFIEFTISGQQVDEWDLMGKNAVIIPLFATASEYLTWLTQLHANANEKLENFSGPSKVDRMIGREVTYEKLEQLVRKLETILLEISLFGDNLVVDHLFADNAQTIIDRLSFKPLDVSRYCKEKVFNYGEKTVMMSATIINYQQFIKSVGIDPAECVFLDVNSTFPAENRPIVKQYINSFNYKNLQIHMPDIIQSVSEILKSHPNEKGIIHTHSYDTAKKITDALRVQFAGRLLFPEKASKQADILAVHKASKLPTVLISPSMTEGVDLKGDFSRFQVIVKVPYPSMGDKIVVARMQRDSEWYGYKTLLTMIQAYGRSTRSETDYSVTYVLDAAFEQLIMRYKKSLPKWFLEAII